MRILVTEDDADVADMLHRGLSAQRYYVDIASDGLQASDMAWSNDYDLLILDIMLPKLDGKSLCRQLRRDGLQTPVLMLTALASENDIVEGLDVGADDYLSKPFSFDVLLARIRSLTRRQSEQKTSVMSVADLTIDRARQAVERGGNRILLTAKEFALLEYFILNKGKVLTRDAISEHVWDIDFDPQSNVVESLVRCLRQKVDKGYSTQLIHTIRGAGYRLDSN